MGTRQIVALDCDWKGCACNTMGESIAEGWLNCFVAGRARHVALCPEHAAKLGALVNIPEPTGDDF